jgi:5-methylcytosine-specific restriction endonuclease McrA
MRGLRIPVKEETQWNSGSVPSDVKAYVFRRDGYACRYCGASGPDVVLEPDHVIPQRFPGSDVVWNLVTACKPCNRAKNGHGPECWLSKQPCQRGRYGSFICL